MDQGLGDCPDCGAKVAHHNLADHRLRLHRRSSVGTWAFVAVAVAGLLVVGYLLVAGKPAGEGPGQDWVGREAPPFSLPTTAGSTFELGSPAPGGATLLFFNEGLMCSPCLRQMADMDRDDARFAALGVRQVAITTDGLGSLRDWADSQDVRTLVVASDASREVSLAYDTLGPDTSMMPGTRSGHTYILVGDNGTVLWRRDYGPGTMYVEQDEVFQQVTAALGKDA